MGSKGSRTQKKFRRRIVGWLERYTIHFYAVTAVLYALMIPLAIWVFPSTTLLLTIVILFTGLVSSVGALASILISLHQNDEIDNLQGDVNDLQDE